MGHWGRRPRRVGAAPEFRKAEVSKVHVIPPHVLMIFFISIFLSSRPFKSITLPDEHLSLCGLAFLFNVNVSEVMSQ